MVEARKITREADIERDRLQSLLPDAAEFFHRFEGEMFERGEAVEELSKELEIDEELANRLIAGLVADEVDPIVQVIGEEKYVGIISYGEHGYYYSFTDWDDVEGEEEVAVCVQCVKEEEFDQDVYRVEEGEEELLKEHLREEHDLSPREVETGATLISGTTIAGNIAYHTANDGEGSGLDADMLHGRHSASYIRKHGWSSCEYVMKRSIGVAEYGFSPTHTSVWGSAVDSEGCIWSTDQQGGVYKLNQEGSQITSFSTPSTHSRGATVSSNTGCVWVTDVVQDFATSFLLLEYDASGTETSRVIASISTALAGQQALRGLGIDSNDCLWYADMSGSQIVKITQGGTVESSIPSPVPSTQTSFMGGVEIDSDNCIWHTNEESESLYKMDRSGSVLSQFDTASSNPAGLGLDPIGAVWNADSSSTKISNLTSAEFTQP